MALAIEIKERKICKSKLLDFTHFSTKYYFFGLYCCETANLWTLVIQKIVCFFAKKQEKKQE